MSTDDDASGTASGWERTVSEMQTAAARLEEAGWTVETVRAGDTAPEPPEAGEADRFGLVHTVPGSAAAAVRSVLGDDVEEYTLYRRTVGSTTFLVTELRAPGSRRALLVAGAVDRDDAAALREAASERGEMYTHLQLLDWTHLGSVRHDDPAAFFPALE
ncbi:MAG: hypothetical protein ABEH77_05945 [Halobacteriaceae archaeon]